MNDDERTKLLALAEEWERFSDECLARAGDEPANFGEVEDDALGTAYGECAEALSTALAESTER